VATTIEGQRIAVFGLGRSGLAVGRAALSRGAHPHIFDQKTLDQLPKRDAYDEALAARLEVTLGWDGRLPDGYDLLVVNPAVAKDHPTLTVAADSGVRIAGEIEFAYQISRAPIVAITGTNGKSTTTVMTYLCLRACGVDAVLCGNIFGSGYPEVPLTEAAMSARADQILVAEVSSFQLEWTIDFEPISAGITNIWPDHLDRYPGGFAEYAETKHRIFANQTERDFAVIKANDPVVHAPGAPSTVYVPRHRRIRLPEKHATGPTVLTFGATGEHARVEEQEFFVLDKRVRLDELPFQEPHNYLNATMAALLAYGALRYMGKARANVLPPEIIDGLKDFCGLAHRMEVVGDRGGIRVVNNSMCTNPDAVIKSTMALRDPVHIIIGGVNKGLDFGPLRHYLANHRHHAYLFGSDAENLQKMLGQKWPIFRTLGEAFLAATEFAVLGEVIMLAPGCASTDQFRDFRERGDVFRKLAMDWLNR
jgi:UDP-N-acetylmuramoylalanine--D-glutamate ligase